MMFERPTRPSANLTALRNDDLNLLDYIARVEAHFNKREPDVLAFVPEEDRFERLRRDAKDLLTEYSKPDNRPELFGLLIGVKDIFHADGLQTHAGSHLPADALTAKEAESVSILKEAGALVLGKTVTTEFAYFAPGPTRNPHNPAHTPGGSSSGSAAAVAARLVPFAFGTQTIGSVVRPASYCGVVGFKPSYNRISKAGVIPLSTSLDHVGFFTPDIGTARLAAKHLIKDWKMSETLKAFPNIGIPTGAYLEHASPEMRKHFNTISDQLSGNGYKVTPIEIMEDFEDIVFRHNRIVAAEAALSHKDWFPLYEELYDAKTSDLIQRGQAITEAELNQLLASREALRAEISDAMHANDIDLWISPSAPGPAPKGLDSTGDPIMNLPWTHSGLPSLNLPSGNSQNGLPLGLQLVADWQRDEKLFAWAAQITHTL